MPSSTTTGADAVRAVLDEALGARPDLVLVAETTTVWTEGLRERHGDERVQRVPIADRGAVAFALGQALGGRSAVVELAATDRLRATLDILVDAAETAASGEFPVPLVVRVPYGTEAGVIDAPIGPWLTGVAGLRIVCPSTPDAHAGLLRTALAARTPTVLLEPRSLASRRGTVGPSPVPFAAQVVRDGTHVTLAAWGDGVRAATQAAEVLQAEQISAQVLDLITLGPLDAAALGSAVRSTGRLVVAHPADPELARRVRGAALDEAFLHLESPLAGAAQAGPAIAAAARGAVHY